LVWASRIKGAWRLLFRAWSRRNLLNLTLTQGLQGHRRENASPRDSKWWSDEPTPSWSRRSELLLAVFRDTGKNHPCSGTPAAIAGEWRRKIRRAPVRLGRVVCDGVRLDMSQSDGRRCAVSTIPSAGYLSFTCSVLQAMPSLIAVSPTRKKIRFTGGHGRT
jgi:hypothetical protein